MLINRMCYLPKLNARCYNSRGHIDKRSKDLITRCPNTQVHQTHLIMKWTTIYTIWRGKSGADFNFWIMSRNLEPNHVAKPIFLPKKFSPSVWRNVWCGDDWNKHCVMLISSASDFSPLLAACHVANGFFCLLPLLRLQSSRRTGKVFTQRTCAQVGLLRNGL